jgi:hypothetical protein
MEFMKSQELIDIVSNELESYIESGLLEPSKFHNKIDLLNKQFDGLFNNEKDRCVVQINNYKAKLPTNFHKLISGHLCSSYKEIHHNVNPRINTHVEYCEKDICKSSCNQCGHFFSNQSTCGCKVNTCNDKCKVYCKDSCGDQFQFFQRIENEVIEFDRVDRVSIIAMEANEDLVNSVLHENNGIQVGVKNGFLNTTFKSGTLVIEYYTKTTDQDGDVLVPADPIILNYYTHSLVYDALKGMAYNNVPGTVNLLNLAKQDLNESRYAAVTYYRTPETDELYGLKRRIMNKNRNHNRMFE